MTLKFRPYQIECLKFLYKWNGRALIGDATGIGKTMEGISWVRDKPSHLPAIIICTAFTKKQWFREWRKWMGMSPVYIAKGIKPVTPKNGWGNRTIIINWDILHYWRRVLPFRTTRTIIADECQACGSLKTRRTKALIWLAKFSPYFIPMSGTPIRSKPGQFFPLLHIIDPKRFYSPLLFHQRYCKMYRNAYSGEIEEKPGGKHLKELNSILSEYMIRREKKDVLTDLPPLAPPTVVPLEIQNRKEYKYLEKQTIKNLSRTTLKKLKHSAFVHKRDAVVEWINGFLESGESLLVFAYHKSVLSFLEMSFGKRCTRVDGSITGKRRDTSVALFKNRVVPLMFAQIEALGVGVDGLQNACSDCAFVEFGRRATDHEQAVGRLDRSGQTEGVNQYYLIAENTIDEDLMQTLDYQTKTLDNLIRGKETREDDLLTTIYKKWRGKQG